jgi:hypothetical protein
MKIFFNRAVIWLALLSGFMIFWITGIMLGNILFPSTLMDMSTGDDGQAGMLMLLVCTINASALMYFIYCSAKRGLQLVSVVAITLFGIQHFMSQIETLWFNDSLKLPLNGVWALISGGLVTSLLFSFFSVWITGKFKNRDHAFATTPATRNYAAIALISVLIWPVIYFLAGYYIAWQFTAVRAFYTGSPEKATFFSMMADNISSYLYTFQILRGLFWVVIAVVIFDATPGSWLKKGGMLSLLLVAVGCSPLLLPNPVMPEPVRLAHLLETSASGVVLGLAKAWLLVRTPEEKRTANPV